MTTLKGMFVLRRRGDSADTERPSPGTWGHGTNGILGRAPAPWDEGALRCTRCQRPGTPRAAPLQGNVTLVPRRQIFAVKARNRRLCGLREGRGNVYSCIQVFFPPTVLLLAGMRGGLRQSV